MKTKSILVILNVLAMSAYYVTLLIIVLLISLRIAGHVTGTRELQQISGSLVHRVTSFGEPEQPVQPRFLADGATTYRPVQHQYEVVATSNSAFGYYSLAVGVINLVIWLLILKSFMSIFKALDPDRPFNQQIIRLLKQLSLLFVAVDVIRIIHYFIFSRFVADTDAPFKLALNIDIGSSLITGLIIWVIAVIYQRGVELQTENELTV
ncbi:DUF2975 domain-containing protein [Chitinophaga rhizophila]|uniref:DUF2975 domain-containing protein n=1 Tax=Chitinophaga rhizophila TaxID=2866212 RepID=A0ABS7GA48_9BACT|nr:DUF2975 domain-containing protein [Chitinophaga rhizophila]MBW8684519.1 DUF2975 domain-containing protein [Chitinophaga rhizophila]